MDSLGIFQCGLLSMDIMKSFICVARAQMATRVVLLRKSLGPIAHPRKEDHEMTAFL
jgi:hypothetical protein